MSDIDRTRTVENAVVEEPNGDGNMAERSWREAAGVFALGIAIVATATAAGTAAALAFDWYSDVGTARAYAPGALQTLTATRLAIFLAGFQLASLMLTFAAARLFNGNSSAFMAIRTPSDGVARLWRYAGLLLVLAAIYGAAVFVFDPHVLLGDIQLFAEMTRTNAWWMIALVAAIGAPIAEEVLFRGLMYGILRSSPAGPVGAAVGTSLLWASVHAQYSVYGLAGIALIGLFLAWAREKTGSLATAIFCHAAYNGSIMAALLLLPERFEHLS